MSNASAPSIPRQGGLRIGTILLAIFLLVSLLGNLTLFLMVLFVGAAVGAGGEGAAQSVQSERIRAGRADTIAIVPVSGTVDEIMSQEVHQFCQYIQQNRQIRGVVLEIDTPGGGITASDEIHHHLTQLKATGRRVVVSMRSLAASGGYYISTPADRIYAQPTTLTGSIGVIWPAFEIAEMMDKVGVTPEMIKSTAAADFKDAGSPFRPFTERDREYIRNLVNHAQEQFTRVVETGRRGRLNVPIKDVAVGKIFTAQEALDMGLIDEIAYLDEVCDRTAADLGIANPTIVRLKRRTGLLESLLATAPAASPKVEVKLDPALLEQLTSPKMQYRAPGLQ